jgi:exopolysaccharide biosynthesis WecB/TagA/CpsF family protein
MLTDTRPTGRQELLGLHFDLISTEDVLSYLRLVRPESAFSYVVTPNVDHVVRLQNLSFANERDQEVLRAYRLATFCVCDSRVLARLARLAGVRLTVVPGSDLTALMFERVVEEGDKIAVVGGDPSMVEILQREFPSLRFSQHIPPMGLRNNDAAMQEAAAFVIDAKARFTFLAIGSPQQELLARRIAGLPGAGGHALCIGAAVEFVSGKQRRAPVLLQKLSLEWAYRLYQEPARLWRRYMVDGPRIIPMLIRWRLRTGTRRR